VVNSQLEPHEKLDCLAVVTTAWTPENGLVTPTLKVKRPQIEETYGRQYESFVAQGKPVASSAVRPEGWYAPANSVDGNSITTPQMTLDLTPMQLGGDTSWTARALDLLQEHGPFKLAYFEAILRIADVRASKKEANSC